MNWTILIFVIAAILAAVLLYFQISKNPETFSKTNLTKSLFTLGILALILIAFIAFLVLLTRR